MINNGTRSGEYKVTQEFGDRLMWLIENTLPTKSIKQLHARRKRIDQMVARNTRIFA